MQVNETLAALVAGENLSRQQTRSVFDAIMGGEATPAQIAGVLIALKAKGETVEEITGAAEAMRAVSTKVDVDVPNLVDTCGTGGSGAAKRFNISTAAAFVAAAAGAHVAKHGNRGASSASGSADVLEAAGANLELEPDQVERCIREVGVGFLFAVRHHAAMRFAGPVRRELGIGTIFNLLGPLTNPAGAKRQVLGVFAPAWQRPLAEVAQALGSERVLVVHSSGLDEVSIQGPSTVVELNDGNINSYQVSPADFGMRERAMDELRAQTPEQSLGLIRSALDESNEAASDIVALNAGAAIYASGVATTLANGVVLAQDLIASGQASEKFKEFVDLTRMMGEV
ncbi:MAG: anthranilate phosphoribosyltransferase [Gammaproteobacteria bacterium]|nr:anthranilate phosphoribosyltransferase [Gammaproteobacteria bacterium]MYF31091.1 anthranilate phosphoribosyltransferase [Gammaproteobacteria bacterium]MYK45368.1 anthranilate phosphoribosyltransferase [Gammaproteobacteria bacterium]